MKKKRCPALQAFKVPFSQQGVVKRHGAIATKKLGAWPFACICIYNVISVLHQKIG